MMSGNALETEPPLFSAVLRPHRSLGSTGLLVLMAAFGTVSFACGIAFMLMGAWPVCGFFGFDVLLLYWAFRVNNRDGQAYEVVTVTPSELTVRKVSPRGISEIWTLNPLWVRLDQEAIEEYGLLRLSLVSRGRKLAIANHLGSREKEGFAIALSAALAAARRGPVRTAVQ